METKEHLEAENSSESEIEDECEYMYIELDGNIIKRIEIPKKDNSIFKEFFSKTSYNSLL